MLNRQIGPYTIIAPLGSGGMGEVYRARDTNLDRDVAIKILPSHFTIDPERRARFAREARVLAMLDHPHIGAIYGLEEAEGATALILALVEGPTLAERLGLGPLPLGQALVVASQIANALAAAHEKGVVHRDLKPANIVLQGADGTGDPRVKVLDFGLAKSIVADNGPTVSLDQTSEGRVLGTPTYMSPEQARGLAVDPRTDVWSFGCVLYEMIVGRPAFRGATTSDTIVKILEHDPDWQALPASTPASIRRLLTRCLEKDPTRRLHAIADANFDLDEALGERKPRVVVQATPRERHIARWAIAALVVVVAAGAWTLWTYRTTALPAPRVMPLTSYQGIEMSPTFSPDGKQVAFSWNGEKGDNEDIYVVIVGTDNPVPITKNPARDVSPAWKPDGSQIAFARMESGRAAIYLVSPLGGAEQKLTDFSAFPYSGDGPIETFDPGLSWSPDGRWLAVSRVTSGPQHGVFIVAEDGGQTLLLSGDDYRMATFSPKGDALACINGGYVEILGLRRTDPPTANGDPRRLTSYLGFVSGLAWTADAQTLVFGRAQFASPDPPSLWRLSISEDGPPSRIDLAGTAAYPAISASGDRLAFVRRGLNEDLFLLREGRAREVILASTYNEQDASFSPDGSKVAFATDRASDGSEIWVAQTNDPTSRRSVTKGTHRPEGSPRWSPDGLRLAFDGQGDDGLRHIYVVDEAGGRVEALGAKAGINDQIPSWSRDGNWIYFGSNRTGRSEIWRAPAAGGEPLQVTKTGGGAAFEAPDGMLYYSRFVAGVPTLFAQPLTGGAERPLGVTVTFWNYVPGAAGLYYMTPATGAKAPYTYEVRLLDFTSRKSRTLHTLSLASMAPGLSVTPDGDTLLVEGVAVVTQDLIRIENFR